MRMIGLLGGLIAAAALAGCAGTQTMTTGGTGSTGTTTTSSTGGPKAPLTSFKCTLDDDCLITVNVVANPTVPTDCTITVDRELVEMNSRGLSSLVSHLIRWQLDDDSQDANFRFANAPDGIVLKEPNDDPNNKQFFKKERSNKGREYLWRDQNSNNKEFKYIINVFQKNSNPRRHCTLDPRIYNN